jgi:small subunit ribosomal protein S6
MSYTIDELPKAKEVVLAYLKEEGADNIKEETLGKKKFAYPINKMSHGYYEIVEFDMDPANLKEVESNLKLANEVLRHVLVKRKLRSEEELAAEQRLREKIAEQEKGRKSIFDEEDDSTDEKPSAPKKSRTLEKVKQEKEAEKVEIGDLDKKLDAILEGDDMLQ